jgi:hypothetical protein
VPATQGAHAAEPGGEKVDAGHGAHCADEDAFGAP